MSYPNDTTTFTSNPYPGLRPFKYEESHLFFGREKQIKEVIEKLTKNRFVGIFGTSGIGKSSFINCGIFPALCKNIKPDSYSSKWEVITLCPGTAPIQNLANAFSENKTALTYLTNIENSMGLVELIKSNNSNGSSNFLLFIDQFEELFRFNNHNKKAQKEALNFIKLITNAIQQSEILIYVIIAMRSDFIGECSAHPTLTSIINNSQFLIPQMTRLEKKTAILSPIFIIGENVEERFAEQLLEDAGDNADALPLIQHALMRTWDYWKSITNSQGLILLAHYNAIGGIKNALSIHAYEAYNELSETQKIIAKKIFKTITEKEKNEARVIRRPTKLSEIVKIVEAPIAEIITVINYFRSQERTLLMPPHNILLNETSIIDISHESLIRIWVILNKWVDEEAESVKLLLKLSEAAELHQFGKTGLWRPPDLQIALAWKEKDMPSKAWGMRHDKAYERTMLFLSFSKKEYEKELLYKEKQQHQKIVLMRIFTMICLFGVAVATLLMIYGEQQRQKADKQSLLAKKQSALAKEQALIAKKETIKATISKKEALEQEKIAKKQTVIAKKNEERANTERMKAEKATAEATHQQGLAKDALVVAKSEKEKASNLRLLSIARSMAVKSINLLDPILKGLVAQQAYVFNKNNGGKKHDPDIYDALYNAVKNLKDDSYNSFREHKQNVRALVSTYKGNYIFSAGSDGKIFKWNTNLSKDNFTLLAENTYTVHKALAISSDEKILVSGGDYSYLQLVDLTQSNLKPQVIKGKIIETWFLGFTYNNKGIISGGSERKIYYWENQNSKEIYKSESKINAIATSPIENNFTIGNAKGQLLLLDLDNNNRVSVVFEDPLEIPIVSMTYSKNGKLLAIGNEKGTVRLFDMSKKILYVTLNGHNARVNNITFSNNGVKLATASFDKTVRIWNMANLHDPPIVLKDHDDWVWSIAFSPDGEKLLAGCKDNLIRVWPTNIDLLATIICNKISRNMNKKEWNQFVSDDIKYEKTCESLDKK